MLFVCMVQKTTFAYIFHVLFSHLVMKFKKNGGEDWPRG